MNLIPREEDKDSGYAVSQDWMKKVKGEIFKDKNLSRLSTDAIDEFCIYLSKNGFAKIEPVNYEDTGKWMEENNG